MASPPEGPCGCSGTSSTGFSLCPGGYSGCHRLGVSLSIAVPMAPKKEGVSYTHVVTCVCFSPEKLLSLVWPDLGEGRAGPRLPWPLSPLRDRPTRPQKKGPGSNTSVSFPCLSRQSANSLNT